MGIAAMSPLPLALRKQLQECDALVVEADLTQPAKELLIPQTSDQTLEQRFSPATEQALQLRCKECHLNEDLLSRLPAWQIALTLQQHQAYLLGLRPEFGIDHQLIRLAHEYKKPIMSLESVEQQLNLLTDLPNDGLSLLEDSLTHWHTHAQLLQKMIDWWISGQRSPRKKSLPLPQTFNTELQARLIDQRNQQWRDKLLSLPPGRYLVAVGALHLSGPNSLTHLLKQ